MSGLGKRSGGGNSTYLRIGMGKDEKGRDCAIISRRAKEGEPGAVPVMFKDEHIKDKKSGEPLFRTEFDYIDGMVTGIEREQPDYGTGPVDVLNLNISTSQGLFRLQMQKGDDYWLDFALRCADIDWSKEVKINPYSIPQEDNPKYNNRFLVLSQAGQKVGRKWKIGWHKDENTPSVQEEGAPPPYILDHDEKKWKKRKVWNWLDENPIQEAIDKVAFLNTAEAGDDEPLQDGHDMPPVDESDDSAPY